MVDAGGRLPAGPKAGKPGAEGAGRFVRSGLTTGWLMETPPDVTGIVLPSVTGDEAEDSAFRAVEHVGLSSTPLVMEPFGDPTVVLGGPPVLGGFGAWRFLRSAAVGGEIWDAGMGAGTADADLEMTAADVGATTLPLPTVDTAGTYDVLQRSSADVFSLAIYIYTHACHFP